MTKREKGEIVIEILLPAPRPFSFVICCFFQLLFLYKCFGASAVSVTTGKGGEKKLHTKAREQFPCSLAQRRRRRRRRL